MDTNTLSFITDELDNIAPLPLTDENYPYGFSMQLIRDWRTSGQRTHWIKITPAQLSKIERILLED